MGEIKYLINGAEVEVISQTSDGRVVVSEVYEDDEGNTLMGQAWVVDRVFDSPPKKRYDEDIQHLKDQIDALAKKRSDLAWEISEMSKNKECEHPMLTQARALLNGKYTHVLVFDEYWRIDIVGIDELDKNNRARSLFALSGSVRHNNWSWRVWHSDRDLDAIFCMSMAEALAAAQEKINVIARPNSGFDTSKLIEFATKHGLSLPQSVLDAGKKQKRSELQRQIDYDEKQVKDYMASAEKHKRQLAEIE